MFIKPLRRITDEESMPLANIKAKVQTHLFPCKPIDIEYVLNTASFNDSGISEKRYASGFRLDVFCEYDVVDMVLQHMLGRVESVLTSVWMSLIVKPIRYLIH